MPTASAEALPAVMAEDLHDATLVHDALGDLAGIDVVPEHIEFILAVVLDVFRSERPRRAIAVGDDEGRRNLDIGFRLVLALVADAMNATDEQLLIE